MEFVFITLPICIIGLIGIAYTKGNIDANNLSKFIFGKWQSIIFWDKFSHLYNILFFVVLPVVCLLVFGSYVSILLVILYLLGAYLSLTKFSYIGFKGQFKRRVDILSEMEKIARRDSKNSMINNDYLLDKKLHEINMMRWFIKRPKPSQFISWFLLDANSKSVKQKQQLNITLTAFIIGVLELDKNDNLSGMEHFIEMMYENGRLNQLGDFLHEAMFVLYSFYIRGVYDLDDIDINGLRKIIYSELGDKNEVLNKTKSSADEDFINEKMDELRQFKKQVMDMFSIDDDNFDGGLIK